jgi:hypothetical protein
MKKTLLVLIIAVAVAATLFAAQQQGGTAPVAPQNTRLMRQTQAEADAKSRGCVSCHEGIEPMHASAAVRLGCTDCHGGDASVVRDAHR